MRSIHFGLVFEGAGGAANDWLEPDVDPRASIDLDYYVRTSKLAEQGLFDFVFIADTLHISPTSAPHYLNRLEPLTMLSALATQTSRIGLVATVSAILTEPFATARQLASLDMISDGRAGWNIVTSAVPGASVNFSRPADFGIRDRYDRAIEHASVCCGLWNSWEPDAFVYDKENAVFFDPAKLHSLDHRGEFYQVAGPLNIQQSRQGRPVLFQSGASERGRDLAARFAEAVFLVASTSDVALEYGQDVRHRMVGYGRDPEALRIMPRISPIIAETPAAVEERYRARAALTDAARAIGNLTEFFGGYDFSRHDPIDPFPIGDLAIQPAEEPAAFGVARYIESNVTPEQFAKDAVRRKLSILEAAREYSTPRTEFVGTPAEVADTIERWFQSGAADGFILKGGAGSDFGPFIAHCVPLLQEKGLYRTAYEGVTLRDHLGLPHAPSTQAGRR